MQSKKQMKRFVISLLQNNLPGNYAFHNQEHTLYVYEKVLEIGKEENCTKKEIELLRAAALWHDAGYITIYKGHEEESCKLAKIHLPGFGYSADDTEIVCGIIMATKIPQTPLTRLEEIIADADLEYLGTNHAAEQAEKLFLELQSLNPLLTKEQWNQMQVSFLEQHQYFTAYCRKKKEPVKQTYLNQLKTALK